MSNDKTLADVQPGGRVRLEDQAERAQFEAWVKNHVSSLARAADGDYASNFTHALWSAWQAALSAQPSPGGQGDAPLRVFSAGRWTYDGTGQSFSHEDMDAAAFVVYRDAALAARQPVGEPVARLIEAVEGECDGLVISMETAAAILAHVSPAAYTPAAYMVDGRIEQGLFFDRAAAETMAAMNAGEVVPLFRSPAQAVDLGAVRALLQRRIEQWRSHLPADPGAHGTREIETKGEHDYNNDVRIYREGIAVMEDVLSKIDGQAVGE